MIGFTHQDDKSSNPFGCASTFVPYVEPSLDPEPEEVKKKNKIEYLPGERLLIKLGKEKKKKKKKKEIDVEKIAQSMTRVLGTIF